MRSTELDQPIHRQFAEFVRGVFTADLGTSIEHGLPVTTLIASRLPATLLLGGAAILLNFTLGLWLGVRQAVRRGSHEDRALTVLSLTGYATPSFWLGLVLAWLVGIRLGWLPVAGMRDPLLAPDAPWPARMVDVAAHLVLPALTPQHRHHRGDDAVPAHARCSKCFAFHYIGTAQGEGAARARGGLAARVAQRALPRHHPLRSVAAAAGDRLGVRRDGVRLAGAGLARGERRLRVGTIRW